MAIIKPLRAWRYNDILTQNIGQLISPPFDVVSEKQRQALYKYPYNSIHLSVPEGEEPAAHAAHTLHTWKKEGILVQDMNSRIYTYYQYFHFPGSSHQFCRKGFICFIRASFWEEKEVLRHEDTIPNSVNDRIALLKATQLNASPTHGLYTDQDHLLDKFMDQSMENPLYQTEDYQGVRDVLGIIEDAQIIRYFMKVMKEKKIILADGHHRYESSLAYRREQMEHNPDHTGMEGYNYHLMYLTNTESEDLHILPTHRVISQMPDLEKTDVLEKAAHYFHILPVENTCDIPEIIFGKRWTFGLLIGGDSFRISLKKEAFSELNWELHDIVKQLDTVVLHHFFIEKVLGITRQEQINSPILSYERNFTQCVYKVTTHEAQAAIITNGISIEQVKQICYSGYIMPQKSTYFYPKAICGFVFGSIQDNEI